jgi:hypothetical protein
MCMGVELSGCQWFLFQLGCVSWFAANKPRKQSARPCVILRRCVASRVEALMWLGCAHAVSVEQARPWQERGPRRSSGEVVCCREAHVRQRA